MSATLSAPKKLSMSNPRIRPDWLVWNDGTVLKLCQTIHDDRRFDLLPILADALEESGCDDQKILDHCRSSHSHCQNCWVIGLILRNELPLPRLDWRRFYKLLDMEVQYDADISRLDMSERCGLWTIPVISRITCNKVVKALRDAGVTVYLYQDDLDRNTTHTRNPSGKRGSYAIHVKATIEADPENSDQSANQRKEQGCDDITLVERLLLELAYVLATKQHLDIKSRTLCSGSRGSDGDVPFVSWYSGLRAVCVSWCSADDSDGALCARSVVSSS